MPMHNSPFRPLAIGVGWAMCARLNDAVTTRSLPPPYIELYELPCRAGESC